MKRRVAIFLAPIALVLATCSLTNVGQGVPQSPSAAGAGKEALTVLTDAARNQGVLVTGSGARIDIASVADDGTTVNCVDAANIAALSDGSTARSLSKGNSMAIIVGTRKDGNPGAWVYSSNKIESVIDEDSGQATSRLPETSEQNGVFRGGLGWVYHVMGVSEDGKIIIGYAINVKGISFGKFHIDPGTTIGVYWQVSRHHSRPAFMVSRAHIIGNLDPSKIQNAPRRIRYLISEVLEHELNQLQLLLVGYLSSYLVMVDQNGVHFDSANNVYHVTGTDQDKVQATATIDQKGNITIVENPVSNGPTIYAAGSYGSPSIACYWVDGAKTDLPGDGNPAHPSVATGVFLSGGSVYVSGYYNNGTTYIACYWVDGVKHDLPGDGTGLHQANATSIYVSGGTVYTAGFYSVGTTSTIACYWTGNIKQDLPGTNGANANSIFVSGTTVYTGGVYDANGTGIACTWTGTTKQDLPGASGANAASVFVSGGTIYTAGQYNNATIPTSTACYWNGTTKLDLPGANGANASSIFVSGSTIYTAGQYSAASTSVACYWTGTIRQDLTGAAANAASVYVLGGTVYTAGYTSSGACTWTGTTRTDLPGAGAQAASIFVQ